MNVKILTDQIDYSPLGALYLADALKNDYNVTIHKSNETNININDADFLLVSAHTGPQLNNLVRVSKDAKNKGIFTVWGGIHSTLFSKNLISEGLADMVITGPGETVIAESLRHPKQIIPGNTTGKTIDAHRPHWDSLSDSSLKQYLFDEKHSLRGGEYGRNKTFYYLVTSRGCSWGRCTFCYESSININWVAHSSTWVKREIDYLIDKTGLNAIGLWDDDFFFDPVRAKEILAYLKKKDIMYFCEARADKLTNPNFVKTLTDTGCMQVFCGMESGNNTMLHMLRKGATTVTYRRAIEVTKHFNLPIRGSFIYGFPKETEQMATDTFNFIKEITANDHVSISGPKCYTPYPGTALYHEAVFGGWNPPKTTEDWGKINRRTSFKDYPYIKLSENIVNKLEELRE